MFDFKRGGLGTSACEHLPRICVAKMADRRTKFCEEYLNLNVWHFILQNSISMMVGRVRERC